MGHRSHAGAARASCTCTRTSIRAKTALIVVDLQNGFMVEEVAAACVPIAVEIVPGRQQAGGSRAPHRRQGVLDQADGRRSELGSLVEWLNMMTPAVRHNLVTNPGARLAWPVRFYPDLGVKLEDEVVQKYRFSAFVQEPRPICRSGCGRRASTPC